MPKRKRPSGAVSINAEMSINESTREFLFVLVVFLQRNIHSVTAPQSIIMPRRSLRLADLAILRSYSPFLALTLELRNMIYHHLVPNPIMTIHEWVTRRSSSATALRLVNKQINHEASEEWYRRAKLFIHIDDKLCVSCSCNSGSMNCGTYGICAVPDASMKPFNTRNFHRFQNFEVVMFLSETEAMDRLVEQVSWLAETLSKQKKKMVNLSLLFRSTGLAKFDPFEVEDLKQLLMPFYDLIRDVTKVAISQQAEWPNFIDSTAQGQGEPWKEWNRLAASAVKAMQSHKRRRTW